MTVRPLCPKDIRAADTAAWAALRNQIPSEFLPNSNERAEHGRFRIQHCLDTDPKGSFIAEHEGRVIGILYVGVLAKKYEDLKQELWKIYGGFALGVAVLILALGLVFARRLTGSLRSLADAAGKIAMGNLDMKVQEPLTDDEIRDLTRTFNTMADSLKDRDEKLRNANQELERTNRSLQKLNRNYLDMLGFVSHELKNTLGVIYTSARALDKGIVGNLTEPQAALVGNIARSIDEAVAMTRDYLDLARIEQGEWRVESKAVNLVEEVVHPVLDELNQVVLEKNCRIENDLPAGLLVTGDPALLRLVYKNLLDNALKYGLGGSIIRLAGSWEPAGVQLEVWNRGDGIAADKLPAIFDKFVRLEKGAGFTKGTGLGLFITREIITKHKGTIRAESVPGGWTRFIFTLPPGMDKDGRAPG